MRSEVVRQAIESRSLAGARDLASVIDARIRRMTGPLVPQPQRPWSERVPAVADPERQRFLTELAAAMDARKERIGEHAAEHPPGWAARALGAVPDDPLDRLEWQRRAAEIGAYRELYGYEHPDEPIGPEPTGDSPEKRAAWHAAFAALGPVDGVDLRGLPDGSLLHMRGTYETETAWAPRHVGRELQRIRISADDASLAVIRARAEERVARERGQDERGRAARRAGPVLRRDGGLLPRAGIRARADHGGPAGMGARHRAVPAAGCRRRRRAAPPSSRDSGSSRSGPPSRW